MEIHYPNEKRTSNAFKVTFASLGVGVLGGATAHSFGFSGVVPACSWKFMLENISGEQMAVRPRPLIWDQSEAHLSAVVCCY